MKQPNARHKHAAAPGATGVPRLRAPRCKPRSILRRKTVRCVVAESDGSDPGNPIQGLGAGAASGAFSGAAVSAFFFFFSSWTLACWALPMASSLVSDNI